jgi:ABC-type multidrug transport system ATPase subunit
VTLILITHRMDEALLCGRIYGMLHGKVEIAGTPDEVLQNREACARLALEVPETLRLARELGAAGLPVDGAGGVDRMAEALCRS